MKNQAFVERKWNKLFVHIDMSEGKITFGGWLRTKINESDISNAELARRVGVSPTYIGNLLRDYSPNSKTGSIRASEPVIEAIAKALNASLDEARLAAGYAPRNEETTGWYKGLEKLSPEDQKRAKRQIRAIIDSYIDDEEKDEDFDYI